jgi:hypothetical protein
MAARGTKPVRQCAGCALNLGTSCAIFHHPSLKWKDHPCEGYNNPMYIRYYETTLKPRGIRPAHLLPVKSKRANARRHRTRRAKASR